MITNTIACGNQNETNMKQTNILREIITIINRVPLLYFKEN